MFITPMVARLKFRALRADVFLIMSERDTCYKPGRAQRKQGHRRHNDS